MHSKMETLTKDVMETIEGIRNIELLWDLYSPPCKNIRFILNIMNELISFLFSTLYSYLSDDNTEFPLI